MTTPTRILGHVDAVDAGARTITGTLVTYGETGRTSAGPLRVRAGAIRIPDTVVANLEHERRRPVATLIAHDDRADALVTTWRVAPTTAGDDLLVEAAEGLRTGLSVELSDVRVEAGEVVAATLTGTGFVTDPAFPSSRVLEVAASEDDDQADEADDDVDDVDDPNADGDAPSGDQEGTDVSENTPTVEAAAPAGLNPAPTATGPRTLGEFLERVTAANVLSAQGGSTAEVTAALADIATPSVTAMPAQWVGELWSGVEFTRRIVPLLNSAPLTSLKVNGWRWAVEPEVGTWTGDKTAIPSNAADTEADETTATRLAGAHDLPREHIDFNTGVIESYYRAMAASYARKSDAFAAAQIVAEATDGGISGGTDLLEAVMVGALLVAEYGTPAYALVNPTEFASLAKVKAADAPAFLDVTIAWDGNGDASRLRLVSSSAVTAGHVVVGAREAATFYELPGVPIRAQALDMVKGGADAGVFGYCALLVHQASAIVDVTISAT